MKKNNFIHLALICLLLIASATYYFSLPKEENSQPVESQEITLSFKDYNYYPNTIIVKQGSPVEITLDKSIGGCYRSFTIPSLGVNVYSANPSEKIVFTPTKKGEFRFACSMGMGQGTIIVE